MPDTYKVLGQGQIASTGTTLITVGSLKQQVISRVALAETSGNDTTIAAYVNGTTAAYCILPTTTIPAGGSWSPEALQNLTLNASETLYLVASVSSRITATAFGLEIS